MTVHLPPSPTDDAPSTGNVARFFVENRSIAWVLLVAVILWGIVGYRSMPQRKDPEIPVRKAVAIIPWPGASAEKVEQLVTREVEQTLAQNVQVTTIDSISRTGVSVVYLELDDRVKDTGRELDDIQLKLDSIHDLPEGAGPINFVKDFGDTSALMLTIASPKDDDVDISLRARDVRQAIEQARAQAAANPAAPAGSHFTVVFCLQQSLSPRLVQAAGALFNRVAAQQGIARDVKMIDGPRFVGVDGVSDLPDAQLLQQIGAFAQDRLQAPEWALDAWAPILIRDPSTTYARLSAGAGDKYTYRQLDDFTDLVQKTIQTIPQVSRVNRAGVLPEQVTLYYSQDRLADYGLQPKMIPALLQARNITAPAGVLEQSGKNLALDPSGEFHSENEIGDVLIPSTSGGHPVYLRDLVDIDRTYQSPVRYLNFATYRDRSSKWQRSRAVTVSVQMRSGEQIAGFGQAVNAALADLKQRLPEDLVILPISDQPLQVQENVELFTRSLYEAVGLVVLISFLGFWEWRSALLMALSIPLTLMMTFGMMRLLGIDIQQVSNAALIIALGLLVDDPVVANDAIKRELTRGQPPVVAAWLGPTRIAGAIMFATITNIVAYLPYLMISGDTGRFLYSLPIVIACSLVASRIVSMTFIPLLGYYLLRPHRDDQPLERRRTGFAGFYYRVGQAAIRRRKLVLLGSVGFLACGGAIFAQLKPQFFPKDLSYLSYVDVWLPEDAPVSATNAAAVQAEQIIRSVTEDYGRTHHGDDGKPRPILDSISTFVGGGGPRFWFSLEPEQQQLNYAQIVIKVTDKHDTQRLVGPLQNALDAGVAGARVDVRQLETGKPVGIPVSIRISGDNIDTLRDLSQKAQAIFRSIPQAARVRDDWGEDSLSVKIRTDPTRANLAGISNQDVAASIGAGLSGTQLTTLREGNKQIPVVARLRVMERSQLSDLQNLYVYAADSTKRVPFRQVSSAAIRMERPKIRRRNQFRTITISCFPIPGALPSEVFAAAKSRLLALQKTLPPGYHLEIAGEEGDQEKGFLELAGVMATSIAAIFLALVFQFRSAIKPFIVFAAIPYGMVGAAAALLVTGEPFGFMAFLGIASLVGVIVSHIIVLFDLVEEMRHRGEPLREALVDAGILRLRPVLITVGATVFALFPLATHGGPLWEPLCYAQIGGLVVATFITLLLVPVLYATFVLDLKLVKWEAGGDT